MVKKVYINNGELNFEGLGMLASIKDLEDDLCCNGEPIEGFIKVKEGYYQWIDLTDIEDSSINEEVDNDEEDFQGYNKITSELIIHKLESIDAVG